MATTTDWTRFIIRININAAGKELYDAWATRSGMEYWFLRLSEYRTTDGIARGNKEQVATGDSYTWRWHGWPDDTTEYGTILDCNGQDFIQFSFGKAGNCSVRIYREQEENIVELVQENIPDDESGRLTWHVGCKTGWTFYLANMKSLYEGGIDLRNKNENLQQVLNS